MVEHEAIKKLLYKNKPQAVFEKLTKHAAVYTATFPGYLVNFTIPLNDIEDGVFLPTMEGQHLARWISWGIESE